MSFEKPQKGNPHQLTVNQHVFPAASIRRFCNAQGVVEVFLKAKSIQLSVRADEELFCAKRVWSQHAEYAMAKIEQKFGILAKKIVIESNIHFTREDNQTITQFYALWNCRAHWMKNPVPDQLIRGVTGVSRKIEKDEQERLEKVGIHFIRPDLTIPGRSITGVRILQNIDLNLEEMQGTEWGICRAAEGEFIVPDNHFNHKIVPISPTIILVGDDSNKVLDKMVVARINQLAVATSTAYYFARELSCCPINSN